MQSHRSNLISGLTLMLLYLTSGEERAAGVTVRRALKGYDPEAIDALSGEGLITTSRASESVYLSEEACRRAKLMVRSFVGYQEDLIRDLRFFAEERKKHGGAFKLRIELDLDGLYPCWREVVVPGWFTFGDLHSVIQAAFYWGDCRLYDFKLRSHGEDLMLVDPDAYGNDATFVPPSDKRTVLDDMTVYLDEVFPRTRTAHYAYSYEERWEHKITLVEAMDGYDGILPVCLGGEGAAPPEEVGSVSGFKGYFKIVQDEGNPAHEGALAWGEIQGYDPFDAAEINLRFKEWGICDVFDDWDWACEA